MKSTIRTQHIAMLMPLLLAACGGGGGGGGSDTGGPPPPPSRIAQTIVYSAGDGVATNGETELYAVSDDGQDRRFLSADMTISERALVEQVAVSPDGQWIAYVSDQFSGQNWGSLYVVPVDGSALPLRLSRQIHNNGVTNNRPVQSFQWSPDSTRLVYSSNQDAPVDSFFANEIFLVNRDGSNERKINGTIRDPAIVEITNPQWSPDGRFIVQEVSSYSYGIRQNTHGLNIYDTTITTPNSRRLFVPRVPSETTIIRNVRWSPDSRRISYMADQQIANVYRVYTIDVVNGDNTQVSEYGDFNSDSRWSPDGATLAYLDHPSAPFPADLVVSAASPGAGDTVLAFLSPNERVVRDYEWSPDGQQIAYTSDEGTQGTFELYVVNADGSGGPTKINGALAAGGDVFDFAWSPDGSRVAYLADQTTDSFVHLYVSRVDGSGNAAISTALNGEEVQDFDWSADSRRIAFSTGPEGRTPVPDKLYSANIDGSDRRQLNVSTDVGPLWFAYDE